MPIQGTAEIQECEPVKGKPNTFLVKLRFAALFPLPKPDPETGATEVEHAHVHVGELVAADAAAFRAAVRSLGDAWKQTVKSIVDAKPDPVPGGLKLGDKINF